MQTVDAHSWKILLSLLAGMLWTTPLPAQSTSRVSVASGGGQADLASNVPSISADGRFVAFWSNATNLVPGDTNGVSDAFLHDRQLGTTVLLSVDSSGVQGNGYCYDPVLSADGHLAVFRSASTNLVPGDTNGTDDIFVRDVLLGTTTRVSVDSSGSQADGPSLSAVISADGRLVAFDSAATQLVSGDTNGALDVFVHDRQTGTTQRVSVASDGTQADKLSANQAVSADGRFVAFMSAATQLVPGDTNGLWDIFVRDLATGTTARVSVGSQGQQTDAISNNPTLSADGRFVSFESYASNLVPGDSNGRMDIFVRDRDPDGNGTFDEGNGVTTRVSVDSQGNQADFDSLYSSLSGDGRLVAFHSYATNLVPGDSNGAFDIFLRDRHCGVTTRVSVDTMGLQADGDSWIPVLSTDGRYVAFDSYATQLVPGDTNAIRDVFVRALSSTLASSSNYGTGWPGTTGIPSFSALTEPVLGSTLTVAIGNSLGQTTTAGILVGYDEADLPSSKDGHLLLLPTLTIVINLPGEGLTLSGGVPCDPLLAGLTVFFQTLELDSGASKGISFTRGLRLELGS